MGLFDFLTRKVPFSTETMSPVERAAVEYNTETKVLTAHDVEVKIQSPEEIAAIIEAIHREFNTEGETLLAEARAILGKEEPAELAKGRRLAQLGFINVPEAKESIKRDREVKMNKAVADRIEYLAFHYPHQRFIDQVGVDRICRTYNLYMGQVARYKGTVPDFNLCEIENFKIRDEDRIVTFTNEFSPSATVHLPGYINGMIRKDMLVSEYKKSKSSWAVEPQKAGFLICAPIKDFDLHNARVVGNQIIDVPDPVVLWPVMGGFLIISAWGLEALDPEVTNGNKN